MEGDSSPAADSSSGEGEPELRELNGAASDLPPGDPTDSTETIDADGSTEADGATDNGTGAVPADAG